ncbi:peptidase domain-containing ABC transporter [Anaerosporobacter sp.]|uniref:peptidase domain-containing ABC transporter n=1 Tax=Anaerosporobacter sp. TaxID=1872529 RepID=UPI00286F61F1|nr:peptidase domain-containing ABC transporter [Anaerosporobacter sp.]
MERIHSKRVPYIEQMRQTECGLCCVAMILQYYKSREGIRSIRKELDVGRDGLKLSVLSSYLRRRGMETKLYKAPMEALSQFKLPAIIFWNQEHFVVLEKIEKNSIQIVDPAFGRCNMKQEEFAEHFSNIIMTIELTERFQPQTQKKHLWKETFQNMHIEKRVVLGIVVASVVTYLLQLGIPMLMERILDGISVGQTGNLSNIYFAGILGIAITYGIFAMYRGEKMLHLQLSIDQFLTKGVFRKLLHLPYHFFESRSNGDILFRLNCLTTIRDLISEQVVQGMVQAGMILCILCYMLHKSLLLTAIACGFLILHVLYTVKMQKKLAEANQYAVRADTSLQGILVEAIYSMYGIKLSGIEEETIQQWDEKYKDSRKQQRKKEILQNVYDTTIQTLQTAGPVTVLVLGIWLLGQGRVTVGEIVAFYSLTGSLFGAAGSLFDIWKDFTMSNSYLERIADITEAEEEMEPEDPIELKVAGEVQLKNVSFSYNKHSGEILKDVTIHIQQGEKVAIVGSSGSGKSTLSKLLLGLYEANEGAILYDNTNLKQLNKHDLRRQIGIVPQEMSLFNKTIYENIAMNQSGVSEEMVRNAAQVAQLAEEIEEMPMKYETLVSDMGMNLSGGQRQRMALARALVNQPQILILDEATSALDYTNEKKVSEYLSDVGCTRIVIAHRLSTIEDADRIIVLDDGVVVEQGRHQELLLQDGLYRTLYQYQMGNMG